VNVNFGVKLQKSPSKTLKDVENSLWWIPKPKKPRISKSKIEIMLICFSDIRCINQFEFVPEGATVNQTFYVQVLYCCREAQARRALERWLIDSSPRQGAGIFFASSVAIFSRKKHLRHTLLTWLQLTFGCFQNSRVCWKESVSLTLRTLNHLWKKKKNIPVQDFKNCFEQRPKRWEHCKELEGVNFEKF
jgi:hypothetical protein